MYRVAVLVLDDAIAFDVATPIETLGRVRLPDGRPGYRIVAAGPQPLVDAGPIQIGVGAGLDEVSRADLIVVPGRNDHNRAVPPEVVEVLRAATASGTRVASICVGAFILAASGLLDRQRATTHWLASDELARRHPYVEVDADALFTDNGQILTSGGGSAGLDLCLHIIERDYGVAVAADAARLAVAPLQRTGGQRQYILRNRPTLQTATLEKALSWIEENAHQPLTLKDIGAAAGMSSRTLARHFHAETGQSPIQWLTGVRIRHAQELLEITDHTIDRIAAQVGFPSTSNFRTLFAQNVGVNPGAYRAAFRPSADDAVRTRRTTRAIKKAS